VASTDQRRHSDRKKTERGAISINIAHGRDLDFLRIYDNIVSANERAEKREVRRKQMEESYPEKADKNSAKNLFDSLI